jgi:hypothetical protein
MSTPKRSVPFPKLKFSRWHKWNRRARIPGKNYPGVYVLAITRDAKLSGRAVKWEDVDYIGMSVSRGGVAARLNMFNQSIRQTKTWRDGPHAGGNLVRRKKGRYEHWNEHLYVAAMTIPCNMNRPTAADYRKMGWVAYLEYDAFAAYWRTAGRLNKRRRYPRFNSSRRVTH